MGSKTIAHFPLTFTAHFISSFHLGLLLEPENQEQFHNKTSRVPLSFLFKESRVL
jgi:hypothetical protein